MVSDGSGDHLPHYDRDFLLSPAKRNHIIELWEVEKFGRDSFGDPNAASLYGMTPAQWYTRGVRNPAPVLRWRRHPNSAGSWRLPHPARPAPRPNRSPHCGVPRAALGGRAECNDGSRPQPYECRRSATSSMTSSGSISIVRSSTSLRCMSVRCRDRSRTCVPDSSGQKSASTISLGQQGGMASCSAQIVGRHSCGYGHRSGIWVTALGIVATRLLLRWKQRDPDRRLRLLPDQPSGRLAAVPVICRRRWHAKPSRRDAPTSLDGDWSRYGGRRT